MLRTAVFALGRPGGLMTAGGAANAACAGHTWASQGGIGPGPPAATAAAVLESPASRLVYRLAVGASSHELHVPLAKIGRWTWRLALGLHHSRRPAPGKLCRRVGSRLLLDGAALFGLPVLGSGLCVAWARMFLGLHFPLDMLGALGVAMLVYLSLTPVRRRVGASTTRALARVYRRVLAWPVARGWVRP